ncbi:TPA: EAL domain-containing protein [Raoultella ornithinolytica]|nr:EAL domain-containing protein [Raoultella ornithinolytica]HDT5918437.1 EAL domain-containing protein [Raoultella ornithinolytica]HDT6019250.1 EAL domain-containing protein [Raoultella ornithinolytica]
MTLSLDHDLLRSDISIRYVFQKMFSSEGTLVAVECLSRFDHISVSPEDFFRYASAELRESIFMEQLALIDKHKQWFNIHGISATINVDDHILNVLLRPEVKALVEHIGCVHFEVTEASNKLLNNALATWGKAHSTTLWLDDFGSGNANINAFRGYHFNYVKIDKDFFWHLMKKESGRPLMDALVTFFSRNHHNVIIEGVESEAHKEWLQGMEWFAIQGHYWKEVSIEKLVKEEIIW